MSSAFISLFLNFMVVVMFGYSLKLKKSLSVITAATPGAFRIFVIIFSTYFIAKEEVVAFSSQYTLAAFFVMVCGIGFSTMLVKRMAEDSGANSFLNYSLSAIFIGGAVAFIGLYLVSFFLIVPNFFSLLLLVISTSVYQVFRNYLIFKRDFYRLLVNDVVIGLLFVSFILSFYIIYNKINSSAVFVILSFSYLISLCIVFFWHFNHVSDFLSKGSVTLISKDETVSSLVVGMSNAASGGVSFILPSFFAALGGGETAVVASIAALVFSSISAVPRGVINNSTAALSKMILANHFDDKFVLSLRRKVKIIIATLFPSLTLFIFIYLYFFVNINDFFASAVFVAALGFYIATAQLGVVESVMINLCGYERQAFYFNVIVFLGIMGVFVALNILPTMQDAFFTIYLLPAILGIVNICRMIWYRQLMNRYFRE